VRRGSKHITTPWFHHGAREIHSKQLRLAWIGDFALTLPPQGFSFPFASPVFMKPTTIVLILLSALAPFSAKAGD
jgi:hypothetical protein